MKKNLFTINQIRRYFKKQYLTINKNKQKEENNIGSITRTLVGSLLIISFFSISPIILEFTKNTSISSSNHVNNSKNDLEKLLEKKEKSTELDNVLNHKFLFEDIMMFDEKPTDSVRLSAATIEELFKSTNYTLEDVRKTKLVKPISLTLLPSEIKKIENTKKRKNLFIQIILPLIIKENNNIRFDRKKLFSILNKSKNTKIEKIWLNSKFKQYGVANNDLSTLKIRMDEVPVSMAIAQAAKETGWGTSRFAQEGNALFGQWTWSGEGIKPSNADTDSTHKVMKFKILQASIRAYQRNLNTHSSYKDFRSARAELRDEGKKLDSMILTEHLDKYAEIGKEYVRVLQQIIKQNNLTDFDEAKLMPSSIDLESLI
ncbi:glucosaminidase domain-containing protein [Candidatus Pelagibacter sp.]|nr:glucosaminidase domain-containing protein [Candidatus Pelagibacter sp.]MDB4082590.1 glucosaminidase domain-containing protein [Candidatus Pelagibacter sp.]